MKQTVKCPNCNSNEYYGMIHWQNGKQYCRHCIERIWWDDEFNVKAFDYYYPLYEDGKDYSNE